MGKISYHHSSGDVDVVEAAPGASVMRTAVTNGVDGIVGECGGQAMCATCHVYVHPEYLDRLKPINENEEEMLDCTSEVRDPPRSRLGCQIVPDPGLDALDVDVPETQV